MAYNNTNFPEWTALDHINQRRKERSATLNVIFSNRTGKTGFNVWYNQEAPDESGKSQRAKIVMTPLELNRILTTMELMARKQITKDSWTLCFKSLYMGQTKLETPRTVAKVLVRRNNGVIGLTIVEGQKQPITFKMLPPAQDFEILDDEKAPPNMEEISLMETLAWIETVRPIVMELVALKTEEKNKPKKENDYRSKESNYSSNENYDDTDIPF